MTSFTPRGGEPDVFAELSPPYSTIVADPPWKVLPKGVEWTRVCLAVDAEEM